MKKAKAIVWIIIVGLFALAVYQNQDFFLSRHSLGMNLLIADYRSVNLPNLVLFIAFFLLGWLIAYVSGLSERYRSRRAIKSLRKTIADQQNAIDSLKTDIASLKSDVSDGEVYPQENYIPSADSPDTPDT